MSELAYLDDYRRDKEIPPAPSAKEFGNFGSFYDADLVHRMMRSTIETGEITPEIMTDFERLEESAKHRVRTMYEASMEALNERK
jgi:hypothetical protein